MPISSGSQPATAKPRKMPSGWRPRCSASLPFISTQADAPSLNWLALPAVTHAAGHGRLRIRCTAFERGVGADALVGGDRDLLRVMRPVALSTTPITVVIGTISSSNLPACLRGGGALLAAHAIFVLRQRG
jgi:hypothetical protein